jgi:hypothetical protein
MLPDYPHKIFSDKRVHYSLLMEALAMDALNYPGANDAHQTSAYRSSIADVINYQLTKNVFMDTIIANRQKTQPQPIFFPAGD